MRGRNQNSADYPTTDPCSETIKAQWLQSAGTHQLVHLRSQLPALVGSAQVIIDRDPAAISKAIAVAIDVATDVGVSVKNEQPNLSGPAELAHHGHRVWVERTSVYQSNLIKKSKALQILSQILETVLRADPRVIDAATSLDADNSLLSR